MDRRRAFTDAIDNGHEAGADGLEDRLDLCREGM